MVVVPLKCIGGNLRIEKGDKMLSDKEKFDYCEAMEYCKATHDFKAMKAISKELNAMPDIEDRDLLDSYLAVESNYQWCREIMKEMTEITRNEDNTRFS